MAAKQLSEAGVLEFLRAIEDGSITLTPTICPQDIYAGDVTYSASNGWTLVIFNDCNVWDYMAQIETPDGRVLDFDTMENTMPRVKEYRPTDEVSWVRYRIPGYLHFRCEYCGHEIIGEPSPAPLVCVDCGGMCARPTHTCACGRVLHQPRKEGDRDEIKTGVCALCHDVKELRELA